MRPRLPFISLLSLLLAGAPPATTQAQQPDASSAKPAPTAPASTPTLSLKANLVNLPVIVRDKKGALVQTLAKSDFALAVDGHNQAIRYFDHDANLPLTLGLLVDTSQSQRTVLDEERDASASFLEGMLASSADHAFVAQFAREVELLQDLTNSKPKLQAGLKQIGTENPNSSGSNSTDDNNDSNGNRNNHRGGGTTLYDAVFLSGDEIMQKQTGRKALIILSDGVDRNSKESLNHSIEAAQRADTIIYAIYFKGQEHQDQNQHNGGGFPGGGGRGYPGIGYPGGGGGGGNRGGGNRGGQPQDRVDGKKILQKMADETGGRLFEVKGKEKVAGIYAQIAEELRTQYRLGYTPDASITGDGYHQVDLGIPAQKNLRVQTRDGYYTGK